MATGSFKLPASAGGSAPAEEVFEYWTEPSDWQDISSVGTNEIKLLVTETTGIGFRTYIGGQAVTFTDTGDLVTRAAHGLNNNDIIAFHTIITTTGIAIDTQYYVVNKTTDTFQVSLTSGGAAIALTNNGSGWLRGTGTYSVNWGDGVIETGIASGALVQHQHTTIPVTFTDSGDLVNRTAHGLSNGQLVSFVTINTTTGIAINTQYYVVNKTTDNFQISLTNGGAAIALTTNGTGTMVVGGKWCSEGYYTWVIQIYNASTTITRWRADKHTFTGTGSTQYGPALSANIGATGIVDYSILFNPTGTLTYKQLKSCTIQSFENAVIATSAMAYCTALTKVTLPASWGAMTAANTFFSNCTGLQTVTLPTSWGNITSLASFFQQCTQLKKVTLPTSWGNVTTLSMFFNTCSYLREVTLPTSWGSVTAINSMFQQCGSLLAVTLPTSWGSITNAASLFNTCASLTRITLPASWGSINSAGNFFQQCYVLREAIIPTDNWGSIPNTAYFFASCYNLTKITLPASWGSSMNDIQQMFASCYSLLAVTLPASWGSVTSVANLFTFCYSLKTVTLPVTPSTITTGANMFQGCYALRELINAESLGDTTTACNLTSFLQECEMITGSILINAKLSGFGFYGQMTKVAKIASIRLQCNTSTFGTSGINVQYTSLSKSALEALFGDITNGLSAKTIIITGTVGADALISKTTSGTTSGSTTVTQSNTSSLATGMEVYGTGLSDARAVTFTDAGDLVNRTAHGLSNGMIVSFSSITTTTGIVINTTYYVVNAAANTFQVSTTIGGGALALTTNGTGNLITIPTIVTVNTNVSIVLDRPASATGSITMTAGVLKRSIALIKGWTITN